MPLPSLKYIYIISTFANFYLKFQLTTCTSLVFLIAMKKASGGFIAAFYTLRVMGN